MTSEERIAVVTGAASGIGAATVRRLSAAGAHVLAVDRTKEGIERTLEAVRLQGGTGEAAVLDLAAPGSPQLLLSQLAGRPLGALAMCAGISSRPTAVGFVASNPESMLVAEVNLVAPVRIVEVLLPALRTASNPRIVAVTSVHTFLSERGMMAYSASKAALGAVVRTLAVELAADGILVNAVAPGFVDTPMSIGADGVPEHETSAFRSAFIDSGRLPLARPATPDEIAPAISFLLSVENTYITGSTLVVDGGLTASL
jgi:3-oxoacyl-[acyl-carrier protein] reductase